MPQPSWTAFARCSRTTGKGREIEQAMSSGSEPDQAPVLALMIMNLTRTQEEMN